MKPSSIRIAVNDESNGYPISPDRVPLALLRSFAKDVDELIRGSDGELGARQSLEVAVANGSLAIETRPLVLPGLFRDLEKLAAGAMLDLVDSKRRAVIEKWQRSAKSSKRTVFEIASAFLPDSIVINSGTDFHAEDEDHWVAVERYVRGEVFELGGLHDTNAHIRLPDGKTLVVTARREALQADAENRLFKLAMVRFKAEYNIHTREYRNAELIEFAKYDRSPDEGQLRKLLERGEAAWRGVDDPQAWVDSLRGSAA